ncbi:MAG: MFS transporter [Acidobacteriota bacterium]|nr:MFS transporter [Acidobacteriota bacterium]
MTSPRPLSGALTLLMAVGVGVMVANLYYLQPVLHQIRHDFHVGTATASLLVVLTQAGYALGLALVVPLGDLMRRRRLIALMFLLAAATMALAALTTSFAAFAAISLLIGLTSVGTQMIVPFAADLAAEASRGRTIARVMSGLLAGILLSRTASGLLAQAAGWRSIYWVAAAILAVMALVLFRMLPEEAPRPSLTYAQAVAGSLHLFRTLALLRFRSWFGALAFASLSTLWTTLSFHLSGAPFHYSNATIGLFGLFGVAGITAANAAGHLADRARSRTATIVAAFLITGSFAILWVGRDNVWLLALGVVVLDAGMQGMQITNQSIIYGLSPQARSRVNSAYMVNCFAGASLGSFFAGTLYAHFGWAGDCWLGGALGLAMVLPALSGRNSTVAVAHVILDPA